MAGLQAGAPTPQSITVHSASRVLEVGFSDGAAFRIPFELMRVYSPSAEVHLECQRGRCRHVLCSWRPIRNEFGVRRRRHTESLRV